MENKIFMMIGSKYGDLRSSEKKAADYILAHMEEIRRMPLDRLAKECGVSQPTVIRLVKALSFSGYREFQYALVENLAREEENDSSQPLYGYRLSGEEALEDIPGKVVRTTAQVVQNTLKHISVKTYQQVVAALKNADKIDICSVENSGVPAEDLMTKLLYLGFHCRHCSDYYQQKICAGNLSSRDVAVGISYSGYSQDTVETIREAKKSGATTIVLTNFRDSLISRYADLLICTSQDQLFYGDAIFSRTTQLMIVDMIYMGIIASDYDYYVKQLNQSGKAIRDKAYPAEK